MKATSNKKLKKGGSVANIRIIIGVILLIIGIGGIFAYEPIMEKAFMIGWSEFWGGGGNRSSALETTAYVCRYGGILAIVGGTILLIGGFLKGKTKFDRRNASTEANKFCPKCGTKVEPDDRFCPECGTKIK